MAESLGTIHALSLVMANKVASIGVTLEDSFPTETSAIAFGEYLASVLGLTFEVDPLFTHTGIKTSWFRLAIPSRHLKAAEALRHAWKAALAIVGYAEASVEAPLDRHDRQSDRASRGY